MRWSGTDPELVELARKNAFALAAGHCFIVFMKEMYPINVLNPIRNLPEVCRIFCATANPVQVVLAETEQGRGILGVIDGFKSKGIETEADIQKRKGLLRAIGYKL
ncbi:MAG: adenosine-specific kinase [Desulfobacterales bacterium]|nr:adenosine-specific kinase [Desulfobacterales bacterium]